MSGKYQQRHRRPYKSSKYDEDDEKDHKSQTKRRKQEAISLASFSSKKGHDRALQEYKKRKETKFHKNATLLREYQRAMKQEGYDAGRGGSRKREEDSQIKGSKKRSNDEDEDDLQLANEDTNNSRRKRHKSDPLHQARKEAERRKAEQQDLISEKDQRQKTETQKQQNRKVRAKKMMRRTKKGQPLMKNVIGDMLGKIKSDLGEGAWGVICFALGQKWDMSISAFVVRLLDRGKDLGYSFCLSKVTHPKRQM